jgi:hypothetical protein
MTTHFLERSKKEANKEWFDPLPDAFKKLDISDFAKTTSILHRAEVMFMVMRTFICLTLFSARVSWGTLILQGRKGSTISFHIETSQVGREACDTS